MAFERVPPTQAKTGMITRAVDYAVTEWAMRVGRHNRQAHAKLHHHPKQPGRNVKAEGLTEGRVEPGPHQEAQGGGVGPGGLTVRSRSQELQDHRSV